MSNELEVQSAQNQIATAKSVASVCKEIVSQTASNIKGQKYVRVEGWQAIAIAHGCTLSIRSVARIEGGVTAVADVIRQSDGRSIASAEGFVGDDESMWVGRQEYARRAMAQTRAMSRAARSAFAHVVVLMDAGLETTPAEEIPGDEPQQSQESDHQIKTKNFSRDLSVAKKSGNLQTLQAMAKYWGDYQKQQPEMLQKIGAAIDEVKAGAA